MSRISETSLLTELSLTVTDLAAAVRFYAALFDTPPVRRWPDFARFHVDEPPLELTLRRGDDPRAGAINHVGFRLDDSERMIAIQQRLEGAGYATDREDGVECCYSRQTKFWATDPDGNLWEIYSLDDEPADRAGETESATQPPSPLELPIVWGHRAGESLSLPLSLAENSVDEVHLDCTLTELEVSPAAGKLLREMFRILKPSGTLALNIELSAWEAISTILDRLTAEGFVAARVEGWRPCCQVEAPTTGLLQASAVKPSLLDASLCEWMYRGPSREVELSDHRILRRGERATVEREVLMLLSSFSDEFTAFRSSIDG
jgi:catechol 2,3-dioxygenase-like lactoylglutathione lyase family enzyme